MDQSWRRGFSPKALDAFEQGIRENSGWQEGRDGLPPSGDQRAKDLIDRSHSEPDLRRAIRLLHRALRYGREDVQALKAYEGLGKDHEQLGNLSRAILYYTNAIELGDRFAELDPGDLYREMGYVKRHLSVSALYRRGRIYARRRDHAAARRDFERAAALDSGPKMLEPELYDLAETYLSGDTPADLTPEPMPRGWSEEAQRAARASRDNHES